MENERFLRIVKLVSKNKSAFMVSKNKSDFKINIPLTVECVV